VFFPVSASPAPLPIPKPSAVQPMVIQPATRIPLVHPVAGPKFTSNDLPSPYFAWTPPFDVHHKGSPVHRVTLAAAPYVPPVVKRPVKPREFASTGSSTSTGSLVVQIAALSRQDDAEVLASSLRKYGFVPSIKNGTEDALYHVQVGPFHRDVAFAAQQKLAARGYNAILK